MRAFANHASLCEQTPNFLATVQVMVASSKSVKVSKKSVNVSKKEPVKPAKTTKVTKATVTKPAPKTAEAKTAKTKTAVAKTAVATTAKSTTSVRKSASRLAATTTPLVLGIDIGGSGIKGAPVDLTKGVLALDRLRIETPNPSTPQSCAEVVATITKHFEHATATNGPIGITYPGVVWDGVTLTAANVDKGWIDKDADAMFEEALKRPVTVLNDAQAAVLAECRYGAARGIDGLVLMLTFGTGIGSGLAYRGVAIPGIELGHLVMKGRDAEHLAAASVKDKEKLSWKQWCDRVNEYLFRIESMMWPELIIVGGGLSDEPEKFLPRLKSRAPITTATLVNGAGIVGAAIAATSQTNVRKH
jgi:polyphosphate glucokinase